MRVARGVHVLRHLLAERTSDLRHLDLSGFRCWLEDHLTHWRHDPVFAQRVGIRDLRRRQPHLHALERQHRFAVAADADSPHFHRRHHLERELSGIEKAIAGLTAALPQAVSPKRKAMRQKLASFRIRRSERLTPLGGHTTGRNEDRGGRSQWR